MSPINTTSGAVPNPHRHPTPVVNTSRVVEEDMIVEGGGSEIEAIVPATGWHAQLADGSTVPLLVFVVTASGEMSGTTLTEDGSIDLSYDVGKHNDFVRYTKDKEKS